MHETRLLRNSAHYCPMLANGPLTGIRAILSLRSLFGAILENIGSLKLIGALDVSNLDIGSLNCYILSLLPTHSSPKPSCSRGFAS
ncbi:hypothetical protein SBA3_80018 [Candidatus Sulfopaludibacter sp. SbA3]|nr:hypothetical protein SBA3_80018 [Candidatus Sulfopaludibacter sp. SbA3]